MASQLNASMSTTDKSLFIVELDSPQERLEIQFVPEKITISSNANQAKLDVVGRNNPQYHYINGEDILTMTLDFYAADEEKTEAISRVKWLQSLRFNDGYSRRKKNVLIIWGDLFQEKHYVWTVQNVKVDYSQFVETKKFRPQQAMVDITLALDPGFNIRKSDFRR